MKDLTIVEGDIVATDMGTYQHFSIVTNRVCKAGLPMLISATKRNGTVMEEPWEIASNGRKTYVTTLKPECSVFEFLINARSQIGTWNYSILNQNCEHFVRWAGEQKPSSTQVTSGVIGGVAGLAIVNEFVKNPKAVHFLGGMILLAGIAVATARVSERVNK